MRFFGTVAYLLTGLVAACAQAPVASEGTWIDPQAFRSCFGIKIPAALVPDRSVQKVSISLELTVLPSGAIDSASIVSGSGNDALDRYLTARLGDLHCAPFAAVDSPDPYEVDLDLDIQVER